MLCKFSVFAPTAWPIGVSDRSRPWRVEPRTLNAFRRNQIRPVKNKYHQSPGECRGRSGGTEIYIYIWGSYRVYTYIYFFRYFIYISYIYIYTYLCVLYVFIIIHYFDFTHTHNPRTQMAGHALLSWNALNMYLNHLQLDFFWNIDFFRGYFNM